MKEENQLVLMKYVDQIKKYSDNLLAEKEITLDEHFKIHEPTLALADALVNLATPEQND